jgi:hypothetical protein
MKFIKKYYPHLLFFIALISIGIHYNYHEIIKYPPQSVHRWRQSDCTSLAMNYYNHGMNFFKPELHSQLSDDRKSGYAVAEFPILYYTAAIFYKIFGPDDAILRGLVLLISFLGLWYLFRIFRLFDIGVFYSICFSLLLLLSPVYVYYANNYLTDVPALSLSIIGWFYFFLFVRNKTYKWVLLSATFFTIASLIKVTAAMNVVVILLLFLLELTRIIKFSGSQRIFFKPIKQILPFIVLIGLVISWYFFAIFYNALHNTTIFSTKTWPYWSLDKETIDYIIKKILTFWHKQYFTYSILLLFLSFLIIMLYFIRKFDKLLVSITLILLLGSVCFVALWFYAFGEHDYYIINLLILPVFLVLAVMDYLNRVHAPVLKSVPLKIIFVFFMLYNVNYAKSQLEFRYKGYLNDFIYYKDVAEIKPYLRSIGIKPDDKIISIPDYAPNYSLYLMNQPGWTDFGHMNGDSAGISKSISCGAKYLVITDITWLNKEHLASFKYHQVGQYKNIFIYKLDGKTDSSFIKKRIVEEVICDAETRTADKSSFISLKDTATKLTGGSFQNSEFVHSGSNSIRLFYDCQYGMLCKFHHVRKGEEFLIQVWQLSKNDEACIVASCNKSTDFYISSRDMIPAKTDNNGWKLISMDLTIPVQAQDSIFNVYLWNTSPERAYFDDFKITRLKPIE